MTKKGYTELEIELYGRLAEIQSVNKKILGILGNNLGGRIKSHKWLDEFIPQLFKINDILKETKIPSKILILNSLEMIENG